jgi:hypothetical protein
MIGSSSAAIKRWSVRPLDRTQFFRRCFPRTSGIAYLQKEKNEEDNISGQKKPLHEVSGNKARLSSFLTESSALNPEEDAADDDDDFMYKSKPIADLFPETTILFADISGFTAWSSTREPCQVFVLLETIYKAFDEIAKRRPLAIATSLSRDCPILARITLWQWPASQETVCTECMS